VPDGLQDLRYLILADGLESDNDGMVRHFFEQYRSICITDVNSDSPIFASMSG